LLLDQAVQKEAKPVAQLRLGGVESELRPPQRPIISLSVLLDHTLERAVRNIAVAGPKQHQIREDAREASIAVLKWMDRKKPHDKNRNHQQGMMFIVFHSCAGPIDEFLHQSRRIERGGRFEDDANAPALFIESLFIV